jgi:hypothetical protein
MEWCFPALLDCRCQICEFRHSGGVEVGKPATQDRHRRVARNFPSPCPLVGSRQFHSLLVGSRQFHSLLAGSRSFRSLLAGSRSFRSLLPVGEGGRGRRQRSAPTRIRAIEY